MSDIVPVATARGEGAVHNGRMSRRMLLLAGITALALAVVLGAWILFFRGNAPFTVDSWWNDLLAAFVSGGMLVFAQIMNVVGGGWIGALVIPLGGAGVLFALRRPWAATYFLSAEAVSAALVQLLKHAVGRARPDGILVVSDYGSFPSGHTANAATLAAIAVVLLPRVWVAVAGVLWVFAMALSRTYLHAHWLSDTLGGTLLGAGAALVLAAAFAPALATERERNPRSARV